MAVLSDFSHLMTIPAIRSFITKARDQVTDSYSEPNENVIPFLTRLENVDTALITPASQAILIHHDIENSHYQTAKSRLLNLDFDKLPQKLREDTAKKASLSAKRIFGEADLYTAFCYPEFSAARAEGSVLTVLKEISEYSISPVISAHIASSLIKKCDFDGASSIIIDAFMADPSSLDTLDIIDKYIAHLESQRSDNLTGALIRQMNRLSEKQQTIFKKRYAARIRSLALDAGRRALERREAIKAAEILEPLIRFADTPNEVKLEHGRALQMQKKSVQARQIWAEIIKSEGRSTLAEKAWYLSYQSFKSDKKASDAAALKAEFETKFPSASALEW